MGLGADDQRARSSPSRWSPSPCVVPTSRDTTIARFDPLGTVLSIAGIGTLVWAVIEGPEHGWTSPTSLVAFGLGAALLVGFVAWERHTDHPMLDVSRVLEHALHRRQRRRDVRLLRPVRASSSWSPSTSSSSAATARSRPACARCPFAVFTASTAPLAAKLAERIGTKVVVTGGLVSMAVGFAIAAVDRGRRRRTGVIVLAMFFLGGGLGLVQAPATEAIMGSLPPAKAGVGSAVNDTARELGGTLGVAIVGSVFSSIYASRSVTPSPARRCRRRRWPSPRSPSAPPRWSPSRPARTAGPQAQALVSDAVDHAFVAGWHAGSWVSCGVVLLGALVAWRFLPGPERRSAPTTRRRRCASWRRRR